MSDFKDISKSIESSSPRLVNIKVQTDGWILEKMALKLTEIPEVKLSTRADNNAKLNYFFNYFQFEETTTPSAAWFTHIEERSPQMVDKWWQVVDAVDFCVFHAEKYHKIVKERIPTKRCITISPGVDFDLFRPRKLKIGVIGRAYPETGRKGEELLKRIVSEHSDIDWIVTGDGWNVESGYVEQDDLPGLYQNLDYLLITSMYEGGPMSALEAIASGVQVISPDIGWMSELPHIKYGVSNHEELSEILESLKNPAAELRRMVFHRTWENFLDQHKKIFSSFN